MSDNVRDAVDWNSIAADAARFGRGGASIVAKRAREREAELLAALAAPVSDAFDPEFNCPTHFAAGDPACPACVSKQPRPLAAPSSESPAATGSGAAPTRDAVAEVLLHEAHPDLAPWSLLQLSGHNSAGLVCAVALARRQADAILSRWSAPPAPRGEAVAAEAMRASFLAWIRDDGYLVPDAVTDIEWDDEGLPVYYTRCDGVRHYLDGEWHAWQAAMSRALPLAPAPIATPADDAVARATERVVKAWTRMDKPGAECDLHDAVEALYEAWTDAAERAASDEKGG